MPSIQDVAARIRGDDLPVLLPDTCILLDIIRATDRCLTGCVEQAVDLMKLATGTTAGGVVVVSSVVPAEWHANAVGVTDEVKRHLTKIQDQSTHFHNACQSLGFSPGFGRAAYHSPGLAEKLRDLSQQILNISIPLDADSESRVRAFNRIMTSTPPAKKGAEVKDCTILEEYLELCRVARAAGFAKKLVFCTSNTRDYCLPGGAPHHNLAADYGAVGLVFTTNLTHATHEIKTP